MKNTNRSRPGYKKTKVGWIPEEWELQKLGSLINCYSGGTPNRGNPDYWGGNIPWVKSGELNQKNIYVAGENISELGVSNSSACYVEPNTLLYALYGATAGVPAFCRIHATINQAILAIQTNGILDNSFLYFWFIFHRKRLIGHYTQGGQPNLSAAIVKSFECVSPSLPEQKKIAEILSTWDEAIGQLRKLIDAKKRCKKALMQQLLTGKKRLLGLGSEKHKVPLKEKGKKIDPNKWEQVKIKDIFKRVVRKVGEAKDIEALSITATVGFVRQRDKFSKVIAGKQFKNYILLRRGEFAYNKGNSKSYPQGCIYRLEYYQEAAVPHVFYCFKALSDKVVPGFYAQYFSHGVLNHHLARLINSGVRNDGLLNLSAEAFFNIPICIPSVEEQSLIAEMLQTADNEINLLNDELIVLKKQKRGLMQKLLTGTIRVKNTEEI